LLGALLGHALARARARRWFGLCLLTLSLDGALNFCCREEKERRLSERSEFASSPSLRQKFKEGVAISARLSLPTFFGKTKKSRSAPAGDETAADHQQQNKKGAPAKANAPQYRYFSNSATYQP
jgi:hypothetical protein